MSSQQPRLHEVGVGNKLPPPIGGESALIDPGTYLGVEIETEFARGSLDAINRTLQYWRVTLDGSLQSASPYEFVFVGPLAGGQVDLALAEIGAVFDNIKPEFPLTTSIHVHMNVADLTRSELRRLLYVAFVCESALIQYSGNRRNNPFCNPAYGMAFDNLSSLGWFLDGNGPEIEESRFRYLGINASAMLTHGTVEFRMMAGTGDPKRIMDWLNVLLYLKQFAISSDLDPRDDTDLINNPKDIRQFLRGIWPDSVVTRMLHPGLYKHMVLGSLAARFILFPKSDHEFRVFLQRGNA